MRALAPDVAERLRIERIDLDPEKIQVRNGAQDPEVALGLGVEIEVEQDVDIRTRAFAQCLEVHDEVVQHFTVDVELGGEGRTEPGPVAARILPVSVIEEDIRLAGAESFFAHFAAERL